MDLFNDLYDTSINILPYDGTVNYFGQVVSDEDAVKFEKILMNNIAWESDQAFMFGKLIKTKRKVAWYGDEPFAYTYSKMTKVALIWNETLLYLKKIVEEITNETYNSCLLNLYHNGTESMSWHSDAEKQLKKNGSIVSLSFGAERKFVFKHRTTKEVVQLYLSQGSLLVMKNETQDFWLHRLPPTKKITTPRINLTFRTIENKL